MSDSERLRRFKPFAAAGNRHRCSRFRWIPTATRTLCFPACLLTLMLLTTPGCDQAPPPTEASSKQETAPPPQPLSDNLRSAWNFYHIHGVDALSQAVACVNELQNQITALIKTTDSATLDEVRNQLGLCKHRYGITRLFVSADESARTRMENLHQNIAAPLEMPGFIDSVPGYPYSGIVNDTSLAITREVLINQHGLTDVSDVSLGFSVIEFLLWGAHAQQPDMEPRPASELMAKNNWESADYELGLAELDINEHPQNRRRRYLEIAVMILEEHLNQLATIWNKHTQPPPDMATADNLGQQIKVRITASLSAPDSATDVPLLTALLPLFTTSASPDDEATHFIEWLKLDNTIPREPDALSEIHDSERPATAKYDALAALLKISTPPPAASPAQ